MTISHLLDTHIVIHVIKRRPPEAAAAFGAHEGRMAISSITLAELHFGAAKSGQPARNRSAVDDFCSRLGVLDYGAHAAQHYGQIRAALERAGTPIGANDLHIAAHARSAGLVLVTHNQREFARVPGLLLEDWLAPAGR
jgi:tRNA(fMet)-specific endonuclease VapC